MAQNSFEIIRHHRLKHVPELKVAPEIFVKRFSPDCKMCHCNGSCCAEGVLVDTEEKQRILEHADLIIRYLEPRQEHDISKWFDQCSCSDIDFPSGFCDGTVANANGCVFLDSRGLCTLQKVAMGEGMTKFSLKPFFCVAFPLVIDGHVLTIDDPDFPTRPQCCSVVEDGSLTVLDVCREEFEYILGTEGLKEIESMFAKEILQSTESTA